MHIVVMLKG